MLVACANKAEQEKGKIVEMTISRNIFALLKSEEKTASHNQQRQDQQPTKLANEQRMIRR